MATDRTRHRQHVAQVRGPVLIRRRADGNDLEQALCNGVRGIKRELQPTLGHVALDQVIESRLVDRQFAFVEPLDL